MIPIRIPYENNEGRYKEDVDAYLEILPGGLSQRIHFKNSLMVMPGGILTIPGWHVQVDLAMANINRELEEATAVVQIEMEEDMQRWRENHGFDKPTIGEGI